MPTNQRLDYIDMAKGSAIALMVFGHTFSTYQNTPIMVWIYSFHMPLFFLTTGILYGVKEKKRSRQIFKLKSKIFTLLLPFFVWSTLYQLFISILAILGGAPAKATLLSNMKVVIQLQGNAMWFLPAMFLSTFFFFLTVRNRVLNIITSCLLFIAGIIVPEYNCYLSAILRAFIGAVFIALGFYGYKFFTKEVKNWQLVCLFVISLFTIFMNGLVSIASRDYNNPFLYIFNGFIGTLIVYQMAMRMRQIKTISGILKYWGENSIKVLCFHGFVIQIIRLFDYKLLGDLLPRLGIFEGIVFAILVMAILTILMPVFNKFFYWSFGSQNKNREYCNND